MPDTIIVTAWRTEVIEVSAGSAGSSSALALLTDVTLTSPALGQTLRYNGSVWVNAAVSYTDLTDVPTTFAPAAHNQAWSTITSTPTTLSGYGITDPVALTSGSYANPAWITSLAWSKLTGVPTTFAPAAHNQAWSTITSTPTTLSGYGVTDPVVLTSGSYADPAWITSLAWTKLSGVPTTFAPATHNQAWSTITSTPTTLTGYGITDPIVLTSGSYANPAWITSLAWSKLTGVPTTFAPAAHNQAWSTITSTPTTLSGYGITDPIVLTSGTYADPAWITSLAWSKLTGVPFTFTPSPHDITAHSAIGLTANHVLVATSSTSFGFAALTTSMLPSTVAYTSISNTFSSTQTVPNLLVANNGFIELQELATNGTHHVRHRSAASLTSDTTYRWPDGNFSSTAPSMLLLANAAGSLSWYTTPPKWHYDRVYNALPIETPNGSTTTFTYGVDGPLLRTIVTGSTVIMLNGVRLLSDEFTLDEGSNQFTMTVAPAVGDVLTVDYNYDGAVS